MDASPDKDLGPRSASCRSCSTIIRASSWNFTVGCQPSVSRALVASPQRFVTSVGRMCRGSIATSTRPAASTPCSSDAFAAPMERQADFGKADLAELADRVRLAGGDHIVVRLARPAASATSLRRSRRQSPSRGCALRLPRYSRSCLPSLIRAAARLIFRVTNVSPRRGDS